jgi:hypothetical protein
MPAARPPFAAAVALSVAAVLVPLGAVVSGDPLEATSPAAEIARLRARIAELEAENARLRGEASLSAALEAAADDNVHVTFDEDTGMTTIATAPSRLVLTGGGSTRHWLTLEATYPGRTRPAAVGDTRLVVATSASMGEYRRATALRLVVDGSAEEYTVLRYATEPITAGRQPLQAAERERVTISLPAAALARMAGAREVRAELGPKTFSLTTEQLSTVRAFRKRLEG